METEEAASVRQAPSSSKLYKARMRHAKASPLPIEMSVRRRNLESGLCLHLGSTGDFRTIAGLVKRTGTRHTTQTCYITQCRY